MSMRQELGLYTSNNVDLAERANTLRVSYVHHAVRENLGGIRSRELERFTHGHFRTSPSMPPGATPFRMRRW